MYYHFLLRYNKKMAPQVGLEPTTDRLTADSSTTELLRNNFKNIVEKSYYNSLQIVFTIICYIHQAKVVMPRPIPYLCLVFCIEKPITRWNIQVGVCNVFWMVVLTTIP